MIEPFLSCLAQVLAIVGTLVAIAINLSLVYGLWWHVHSNAAMNANVAAFYDAISRPLWAITLSWIVVVCDTGNGGE